MKLTSILLLMIDSFVEKHLLSEYPFKQDVYKKDCHKYIFEKKKISNLLALTIHNFVEKTFYILMLFEAIVYKS